MPMYSRKYELGQHQRPGEGAWDNAITYIIVNKECHLLSPQNETALGLERITKRGVREIFEKGGNEEDPLLQTRQPVPLSCHGVHGRARLHVPGPQASILEGY